MGDDKKKPAEKKRGKKLPLKKETIQELDDGQLDQIAGGARSGTCVARDQGPAGPTGGTSPATCSETVP